MNRVILIGRITKDAELRQTQTGVNNVSFTLAVNRKYKDEQGNTPADFINCVAWRQQAEFLGNYVKKGYLLAVEGQLQVRSYQDQQGVTKYVTEVVCDSVENLTPKDQPTQQQPVNNQSTTSQQTPQQTVNKKWWDDSDLPF